MAGFPALSDATAAGTELRFLTEDFPPLSMTEDDQATGQAVELVRALMAETGTGGDIEVMAWSEAYQTALEGDDTVLFSTVLTPERKDQFQWVGPTAELHTALYALAGSDIEINTLAQARAVERIATVTDYYSDEALAAEGDFDNVVRFADEGEAARALLDGQVDLMVAGNTSLPAVLEALGSDMSAVRPVFALSTDLTYLAFAPEIPEETVEQWQGALDAMKADGRFAEIYRRWLPAEEAPGRMYLVTEEYPPITFMQEGRPGGFVTDMVRQMAMEIGISDSVELTSWKNAYNLALLHPNVVLFSAERTDAREPLFHWVGPVGQNSAILYARSGGDIEVDSLADARAVDAVATTTDWFTEQFLQEEGFDNLVGSPDPGDSVRRLMDGEANLAIFTDITVADIVERAGYSMDDLEPMLAVSQTDFYIALSRDTDPAMVARWREALAELKKDGRFERIYRSYVPEADLSGLLD
ncbi:substrate-binding periplasmic protein [Wenzhouxiangella limi]|nr:transporter substrate-binding domain-containing protein [Wenzhouxiangella limi]